MLPITPFKIKFSIPALLIMESSTFSQNAESKRKLICVEKRCDSALNKDRPTFTYSWKQIISCYKRSEEINYKFQLRLRTQQLHPWRNFVHFYYMTLQILNNWWLGNLALASKEFYQSHFKNIEVISSLFSPNQAW